MDARNLPGSIKAAILIQSAGKVMSERILNRLEQQERKLVTDYLAQMGKISPDLVERVAEEFLQRSRPERARSRRRDSVY